MTEEDAVERDDVHAETLLRRSISSAAHRSDGEPAEWILGVIFGKNA